MGEEVCLTSTRVENISELINSSMLGVIPSLWSEDICRVAQEFLLCGVPVFVSGVGALEDCLFSGAGVSYKNQPIGNTAKMLHGFIVKTIREDINFKPTKANADGKSSMVLLQSLADFEHMIIKRRQKEGIYRAKKMKKYKGRKATLNPDLIREEFSRTGKVSFDKEMAPNIVASFEKKVLEFLTVLKSLKKT